MNAENSHNAKTPSLIDFTFLESSLAKPPLRQPEADSVRCEIVWLCRCLVFQRAGRARNGRDPETCNRVSEEAWRKLVPRRQLRPRGHSRHLNYR